MSDTELPTTSFVKGKSSGASGYAVYSGGSSTSIYLNQTSGSFSAGEQIIINGNEEILRSINTITVYDSNDIKSIFQSTSVSGLSTSFAADTILYPQTIQGFSSGDLINISVPIGGIATVTSAGKLFTGIKQGSIIRYSKAGLTVPTYNKVTGVSADGLSMQITSVPSVIGVCDGGISTSSTNVAGVGTYSGILGVVTTSYSTTFSVVSPRLENGQDSSLFSILPNSNISSVNLSNSQLTFTSQSTVPISVLSGNTVTVQSNSFNLPTGLSTALFQSFDAERYSIHYSDGTTESLTADKVDISGGTQVTFNGIQK